MAFNKYANGAWQEAETAKRYANGAWQECESAKRYVNGAWQEVWTNAIRFLKDGVLRNGATLGTHGKQGSGSVYGSTPDYNETIMLVNFQLTSDMVGKKLYVKASSNVIPHGTGAGNYGYLMLTYPSGDYSGGGQWCESSIGDLLTFTIQDYHVAVAKNSYIGIDNTAGSTEYHIYDIYVDD